MIATLIRRSIGRAAPMLLPFLLLLICFQLILVAQAASIESTRSFERLTNLIPAFLQRGIGSSALLLATFRGTVTFGYFHPVILLMVAVLTIYMAAEPAYDIESGLVDLLLARAVPRHYLITRSLLVATVVPIAAAAAMALGTWTGLHLLASPDSEWPSASTIARLLLHVVPLAWCFGALGLAVAAGARRWSRAFASVAFGAVALYLLDILAIGWPAARGLAWISPFHYYPALPIVAGTVSGLRDVTILMSAAIVLNAVAYWRFSGRDL